MPHKSSLTKQNLKKLSQEQWGREHFDGCPAFMPMTIKGFTSKLYDSDIPAYGLALCYYSNREGDWFTRPADYQYIGGYIVKKFLKDKKFITNLYQRWLKNFHLMMDFYYHRFGENLRQLSDKELLAWADEVCLFYRDKVSMPGFLDGFMFYADKRLDALLRDFCQKKGVRDCPKIYSILSAPVKPSFINEEAAELSKISRLIVKTGFSKQKNLKIVQLINEHLFKWSWIKSSYVGYKRYTIADVETGFPAKCWSALGRKPVSANFNQSKRAKVKLIRKYKFTPEILAIAKLAELFIKWQDQRKNYTLTFVVLQEKILKEASRRSRIDLELLRYSVIEELRDIITGQFSQKELIKRQESSLFIFQRGKIKAIFTGHAARNFFNQVTKVKIEKVKEIHGITASLGHARGRVKIILSAKYINKVQKGDILVAPMTRPEHLSAMKKAAAIITDEGGITCHAAIVSRELGVPCLIGTKIATKVLKDGDLVEVDATLGVVKKIN
ncbi:MAG: PEP-utilizing enzyme [Candidatus Jacksonbacteria bacterium]